MGKVYILGVSMTQFGRLMTRSVKDLAQQAVRDALVDAQIGAESVEATFFANASQGAIEGQHSIRGEIALLDLPLGNTPIVNVENACAGSSTALNLAVNQIKAGAADVVLAIGVEKMVTSDKALSFSVFNGSWDVHEVERTMAGLAHLGSSVPTPAGHLNPDTHSVFMDVYQATTKSHMHHFGTTQRQMAQVCAKNHFHSTMNPRAQFQKDFSVEEVLAGRVIAWPITLPMCSPVSDGASAAVLCSERMLGRLGRSRAVELRASVLLGGGRRTAEDYTADVSHAAAKRAYEQAGLGPAEISVAEVHDATAPGEIQQSEYLMLCDFGQGGPLAESGATARRAYSYQSIGWPRMPGTSHRSDGARANLRARDAAARRSGGKAGRQCTCRHRGERGRPDWL
jgi:acetyl-CoA acetyltransferase